MENRFLTEHYGFLTVSTRLWRGSFQIETCLFFAGGGSVVVEAYDNAIEAVAGHAYWIDRVRDRYFPQCFPQDPNSVNWGDAREYYGL